MDDELTVERQLRADIERLRGEFADTQELYREVCVLLFFRHGITPTANRLYQLVRKGSMSAPATALAQFWDDLRDKSSVRIEHPDLPETVKLAAGELVGSLWAQAMAAAKENLAAFRTEAQATILEARAQTEAAQTARQIAEETAEARRAALDKRQALYTALEQTLQTERSAKDALQTQLEEVRRQSEALQAALDRARNDFTIELEKVRQAQALAEERCTETERRALVEVDRERTASAKLAKELEQLRSTMARQIEAHRQENSQLHEKIAVQGRELGIREGSLAEARAQAVRLGEDLHRARAELARQLEMATEAKVEIDNLKLRIAKEQKLKATKPKKSAVARTRMALATKE